MRILPWALVIASLALAAPAVAQTTPPYPSVLTPPPMPAHTPNVTRSGSARPTPVTTFRNPSSKQPVSVGGQACNQHPPAPQQRVNPITGQPQATTIVSVPVTSGSGSIKNATTRQQQADACAHER